MMKINEVELASNLAHAKLIEFLAHIKLIEFAEQNLGIQDENDLYENVSDDEIKYKEDMQDLFDQFYDIYYDMISNTEES